MKERKNASLLLFLTIGNDRPHPLVISHPCVTAGALRDPAVDDAVTDLLLAMVVRRFHCFGKHETKVVLRHIVRLFLARFSMNVLDRYIHLNPSIGKRPLVEKPELWTNRSYPGLQHTAAQTPITLTEVQEIMQFGANEHHVKSSEYVGFRSSAAGRDIARFFGANWRRQRWQTFPMHLDCGTPIVLPIKSDEPKGKRMNLRCTNDDSKY